MHNLLLPKIWNIGILEYWVEEAQTHLNTFGNGISSSDLPIIPSFHHSIIPEI